MTETLAPRDSQDTVVTVRFRRVLANRVEQLARDNERSLAAQVRVAVRAYLEASDEGRVTA